jgi:hypothetical protein
MVRCNAPNPVVAFATKAVGAYPDPIGKPQTDSTWIALGRCVVAFARPFQG